jgi:hypothetical protein
MIRKWRRFWRLICQQPGEIIKLRRCGKKSSAIAALPLFDVVFFIRPYLIETLPLCSQPDKAQAKEASRERPTRLIDQFCGRLSRYAGRDAAFGLGKAVIGLSAALGGGCRVDALHFVKRRDARRVIATAKSGPFCEVPLWRGLPSNAPYRRLFRAE